MIQLTPEEKDYIKNELSGLLKKNAFSKIMQKLLHDRENVVLAFMIENNIPILQTLNNIPSNMLTRIGISQIVIPGNIKRIGENAFDGSGLINVKIEEGVKEIENAAFAQCTGLVSVELPESLERIGTLAFAKSGLKQINIPDSITYLERSMFGDNNQIKIYANSRKEMPSRFKLRCNRDDIEWFKEHLFLKGEAEEGENNE